MNSRFLLPAAAIALFSAAGLVLVARTAAVPSASLPPSLLASSPASSIAPLDTLTMEESIRRLLELDRANDQVRNQRNVYFADANYPIVFGDLDGDHDPDAAALAVWEYGGSGWEQRLYVLRNNGG
ncbi:MAG: hypothetical protein JNJ94_00260, partial [Chlorobi bacterium]|nr:hypothetical protein [Chlorobiota bacterium]